MMAVCVAVAEAAIARGNNCGGTRPGSSVCMIGVSKARATPVTNKIARNPSRLSQPPMVPIANATAAKVFAI